MKDSGIQWIGQIPENWRIERFKFTHQNSNVGESIDKNFCSERDGKLLFYTAGLEPITTNYSNFPCWKYTKERDLLLARNGTPYVYLPKEKAVYSDHIIRVTINDNYSKRFIRYCLQQAIKNEVVDTVSITTWSVPIWDSQYLSLPSIEQQKRIADFLDQKTTEIQFAIDNTKQTIEEYKKLKQAVITKAVTKGLEPNRKMKDSGIEWIGEIPDDWEVRRFGRTLNERSEKNNPIKSKERLSCSIDIGVTLYSEKTTNLDRFKDDFTQYKIAHVGDLVMNSMNVIVGSEGISAYYGCVSPAYYTYYDEVEGHYTARFCDYILKTKGMKRLLFSLGKGIYAIERGDDRVNTCRLKVPREDLKAIKIPLPELNEQKKIVEYLDNYSKQIDTLISQKEQFITELEKYKQSLIYEYVTGKRVLN